MTYIDIDIDTASLKKITPSRGEDPRGKIIGGDCEQKARCIEKISNEPSISRLQDILHHKN